MHTHILICAECLNANDRTMEVSFSIFRLVSQRNSSTKNAMKEKKKERNIHDGMVDRPQCELYGRVNQIVT